MKNKKLSIRIVAFVCLALAGSVWPPAPFSNVARAQVNPWPWPDEPTPTSTPRPLPKEVVKMSISFQREECTQNRGMTMCSVTLNRDSSKSIALEPTCAAIGTPSLENEGRVSTQDNTPPNHDCNFHKGYWIDLYHNQSSSISSERYIGILTISKTSFIDKNGQPVSSYTLVAEVLGRTKTLAKAEANFNLWSDLQNVRLMANEEIRENYFEKVYLSFGPLTLEPEKKNTDKGVGVMMKEPIQWKVLKGQIVPL